MCPSPMTLANSVTVSAPTAFALHVCQGGKEHHTPYTIHTTASRALLDIPHTLMHIAADRCVAAMRAYLVSNVIPSTSPDSRPLDDTLLQWIIHIVLYTLTSGSTSQDHNHSAIGL